MIFRNAGRIVPAFLAAFLISACAADAAPPAPVPMSSAPAPSAVPSKLAGAWAVTSAKTNTAGIAAYLPDDPALLRLRLAVTGDSLAMDGHSCESPQITSEPVQFSALIQQTYEVSPADMGVSSADETHTTNFITCGQGDIGPSYDRGSWIAEIGPDTIAMNWFDSVLLYLKKAD
jgi:hypothetical protein